MQCRDGKGEEDVQCRDGKGEEDVQCRDGKGEEDVQCRDGRMCSVGRYVELREYKYRGHWLFTG